MFISSDRIMHLRSIIEEYSPVIKYIAGPQNEVANDLIQLHVTDDLEEQHGRQLKAQVSQVCNKEFINSKDIVEQCLFNAKFIYIHEKEELTRKT